MLKLQSKKFKTQKYFQIFWLFVFFVSSSNIVNSDTIFEKIIGKSPSQELALCKMEGRKYFNNDDFIRLPQSILNFFNTCMVSKGFKLNGYLKNCPQDRLVEFYGECYEYKLF